MEQCISEFSIAAEHRPAVLEALKALAIKASKQKLGYYHWVNTKTLLDAKTIEEHLNEWRWEPTTEADGSISSLDFSGEKYGDEEQLFDALAPFVTVGSYIIMSGDDNDYWRWYFNGKVFYTQEATITFEDPVEEE
jgi:hypothetical protein